MQAVVRSYSGAGAKDLVDILEKRKGDVEGIMRSVAGFVSYTLVRSGDGGYSMTVCQDQAGIDESSRKAKEWVTENAGQTGAAAPQSWAGSVIVNAM